MKTYGSLNAHALGIILKELVRRAITEIRRQRQVFEVTTKVGYDGGDDLFTTADTAAQHVYLRSLKECFPGYGIIAEEDAFSMPCTDGSGLFVTVDPLDGTRAFKRRQSHGVGTMISLSKCDQFLAAYVGDINTQEIFGFRPKSSDVHRISEFNSYERLRFASCKLRESYVLLRDPSDRYSSTSQGLIRTFKNQIVDGGSIGIWLARLWKGEVAAALLGPSMETPWDSNPVHAISQKMGFVCLRPSGNRWIRFTPKPIMRMYKREHDLLFVHRDNVPEVMDSTS